MAKILSENAQTVLGYLQANQGAEVTAAIIAEATGLSKPSVNGTLTGLQKETKYHPSLLKRVEVEGSKDKVIELTADGITFDLDADRPEPVKEEE